MRFKKLISAFLAAAFCVSLAGMAFAEKLTKVPTAWMDEHETFLIWYAKEKGWDKEAGLDIDIQYFGSGMDILNALPSGSWVFAGMGGVPAMMGNLRYGTSVIAIGNDESMTNSVLVRPDSPIAKVKDVYKRQALLRARQASSVPAQRHVMCFMVFFLKPLISAVRKAVLPGCAQRATGRRSFPGRVECASSIRLFPGVASVRKISVNTND